MNLILLLFLVPQIVSACPGSGQISVASAHDSVILTSTDMDSLIQKVKAVYDPIFHKEGMTLQFNTHWDSPMKNAFASQGTGVAKIDVYGGLGKAKYMSRDHFILLMCHEIGHHLGGEPRMHGENYWSSMEPQADYFAGKECLKKVLEGEVEVAVVPKVVDALCQERYPIFSEYATCTRSALAAELFGKRDFGATHFDSEPEAYELKPISLLNPWGNRPDLAYRFGNYPSSQCRLDTIYQGALCNEDECSEGIGMKPVCWTSVERF